MVISLKKNIALKVRIYPNKNQKIMIDKTIGCNRYMYNQLLAKYNETGEVVGYTQIYNEDNIWLKESDTSSYANTRMNLKRSIKNHYDNPIHFGIPSYKSKHNHKQSYTTSVTNNNSRVIDKKHLRIPKIGILKAKIHRMFPNKYTLKSITISKENDGKYYASLLYEYESLSVENQTDKPVTYMVGIDYSQEYFGVLSNGTYINYPKYLVNNMNKLALLQQRFSRCTIHSNNWYKRKEDIAKLHIKIRNQRKDFINKLAKEMSDKFDIIAVEDLNLQEMSKSNHLGKKIYDNSFGMFITKLGYKLEEVGKSLVKVDKYYPSSKRCSNCSHIKEELKLSDRTYTCCCGNIIDRDYNAAINIAIEGYKMLYQTNI